MMGMSANFCKPTIAIFNLDDDINWIRYAFILGDENRLSCIVIKRIGGVIALQIVHDRTD